MKQKILAAVKVALPISVGLYLVWSIYHQLDSTQKKAVFESFAQANYAWIVCSLSMGALSHFIRGYRWKLQLHAMKYETTSANNFMAVMIGYIINMVLPRVGEVSRAATLSRYEQVPFQKSFGSILSERALDLIILLSICMLTLGLQYDLLKKYSDELIKVSVAFFGSTTLWMLALGAVALLAVFILVIYPRIKSHTLVKKGYDVWSGLIEGLRSIVTMPQRWNYLLLTALIWILYLGMFWVCFLALDATSTLGAEAVFASFVVGSFAIVLIPGGIGAYPVGIMESLLLYGIAAETGFALGWIIWLSQTAMVVVLGGISMWLMPFLNKQKAPANDHASLPE